MADEPTIDESTELFFAPPETAKRIIHALQKDDEDDVSGYSMVDLNQFTYQPLEPQVRTIEGLRAKDLSGPAGQMADNCSLWPIGGY